MIGGFIAATVVAVVQYVRTRDRRLLLLMAMFLLQALSLRGEPGDRWRDLSQAGVILAGLVLVLSFSVRSSGAGRS